MSRLQVKRGQAWESMLDNSFARLPASSIVRLPAPTKYLLPFRGRGVKTGQFVACYEKRGTCDYEGFYREFSCTFDAKRTSGDRWDFSSIADHQIDRMRLWDAYNHAAGVLLWWDCQDNSAAFFGIDIRFIDSVILGGRKSIRPEHLLEQCDQVGSGVRMLRLKPWGVDLEPFFSAICSDRRGS